MGSSDLNLRSQLQKGLVIPAHPLALNSARKLDERRQRALTRYYLASGAGGLAVGVHTTQFAIRDPKFAREFLMASIDEGVALQVALGKVVRAMGVKEFAAKVRMASPNVLRAINPRHNPTQATISRFLRPFGLRLSLAVVEGAKRRSAA